MEGTRATTTESEHRKSHLWAFLLSAEGLKQTPVAISRVQGQNPSCHRSPGRVQEFRTSTSLFRKILTHAGNRISHKAGKKTKDVRLSCPAIQRNPEDLWEEVMTESEDMCSFVAARSNSVLAVAPVSCPPPPTEHKTDPNSHHYYDSNHYQNSPRTPRHRQTTDFWNNQRQESISRTTTAHPRHMLSLEYLFYSTSSHPLSESSRSGTEIGAASPLYEWEDRETACSTRMQKQRELLPEIPNWETSTSEESAIVEAAYHSRKGCTCWGYERGSGDTHKSSKAIPTDGPNFKKKALGWRLRYKRSIPIKELLKKGITQRQG